MCFNNLFSATLPAGQCGTFSHPSGGNNFLGGAVKSNGWVGTKRGGRRKKNRLEATWSSGRCPWQGGEWDKFKVPSNWNHSAIPWINNSRPNSVRVALVVITKQRSSNKCFSTQCVAWKEIFWIYMEGNILNLQAKRAVAVPAWIGGEEEMGPNPLRLAGWEMQMWRKQSQERR